MTAQSPHQSIQNPNIYPALPNQVAFQPPMVMGKYEDDLDFGALLKILRRRWLVIGGITLAVSGAIWSWTLTRTPIFQGEFRVLIESIGEANPSKGLLLEDLPSADSVDYGTQIEVLKSPVLLGPIAQALQEKYPDLTVNDLLFKLSVSRLRDTKVLSVSYRDPSPQRIQDVLKEVSDQYLDYSFEQRQASLQQGIQFVDDKLPELRDRVTTLQVRLERFRQQYSILDPEIRGNEISGLLASVESQRQSLQAELSQAQSLYQSLQGQLQTTPEVALSDAALSQSARYQSLLNQLQDLEAEIALQSAKYQADSPQIEVLEERRDNLRPLLDEEAARILGDTANSGSASAYLSPTELQLNLELIRAANNLQQLQARNRTLVDIENNIKEEFDLVPGLARQYTDLQRELAIATESLNRFLTTRETLQIDAAQKSVPWQLISSPYLPTNPISPNIPRNLTLGIIAGLLMGSAAALLTEKLDQVFHSADDLKQAVPLPLLGVIPFFTQVKEHTSQLQLAATVEQNGGVSGGILEGADGALSDKKAAIPFSNANSALGTTQSSAFLEAFRSLYTNVRFLGTDRPIQSIVVSSAVPGEGKTTNSIYLARTAAMMGQRILLVDADLRAPKHHTYLNLTNIRGLSNAIAGTMDVMSLIQRSPLDSNLSILTAGPKPPDPIKLLSSQKMQSVMETLKNHYDLVIYDMPPLTGFADSTLLASHTDGLVLVVGLGRTERSVLTQALDNLKISPVTVLGMVANGIKAYTTPRYGQYSPYSHYYSDRNSPAPSAPIANAMSNRRSNPDAAAANQFSTEGASEPLSRRTPYSDGSLYQDRMSYKDGSTATTDRPSSLSQSTEPSNSYSQNPVSSRNSSAPDYSRNSDAEGTENFVYDEPGSHHSVASASYPPPAEHPDSFQEELYDPDEAIPPFPPVTTVTQGLSPLQRLKFRHWAVLGVAALLLSSFVGWALYNRVLNPSESSLPEPTAPDQSLGSSPTDDNDNSPVTNGNADLAQDAPSTDVDATFSDAVRLAQSALKATETASTAQDWSKIAKLWQDAAALMAMVPENDPHFQQARDRTITYRSNAEYARRQVLQLLQPSN
ncbi:MAG: polysaccharide biosynthesis tyrosine autokinase [Cyanobacteria bacterium P01_F01_bin.150]